MRGVEVASQVNPIECCVLRRSGPEAMKHEAWFWREQSKYMYDLHERQNDVLLQSLCAGWGRKSLDGMEGDEQHMRNA